MCELGYKKEKLKISNLFGIYLFVSDNNIIHQFNH
jgi:hypothetical protein